MRTDFAPSEGTQDTNMAFEKVIDMELDPKAHAHFAFAFSNIYADPELAVIREYIANAVDAVHGNDGTVEVIAPTEEMPAFVVIDTGRGMSLSTVENVLSKYFGTDKNTTSDQIGGWGVGFQSGLAVADQFSFVTTKDEITTRAVVSKADIGLPKMKIISSSHTPGKPNGTAVTVPVQDIPRFNEKLSRILFFQDKVDITTTNIDNMVGHPSSIKDDLMEIVFSLEHIDDEGSSIHIINDRYTPAWSLTPEKEQASKIYTKGFTISMGGVPYDVPTEMILKNVDAKYHEAVGFMSAYMTIIDAPIDSVTLSPNREGVQFTDKTRNYLQSVVASMYDSAVTGVISSVSNADTLLEAIDIYNNSPLSRHNYSSDNLMWNSFDVVDSRFRLHTSHQSTGCIIHYQSGNDNGVNTLYVSGSYEKRVNGELPLISITDCTSYQATRTAIQAYMKFNGISNAIVAMDVPHHSSTTTYGGFVYDDLKSIVGESSTDISLTHKEVLAANRKSRKELGITPSKKSTREAVLSTECRAVYVNDSGEYVSRFMTISDVIGLGMKVYYSSRYPSAVGPLIESAVKSGKSEKFMVVYDARKSGINALVRETDAVILDTPSDILKYMPTPKVTKGLYKKITARAIHDEIDYYHLLDDEHICMLKDPLARDVLRKAYPDASYEERYIGYMTDEAVSDGVPKALGKLYMYAKSIRSLDLRRVSDYACENGVLGFDGIRDRLAFIVNTGYYHSNDNSRLVRYTNTDYADYKKGKKK